MIIYKSPFCRAFLWGSLAALSSPFVIAQTSNIEDDDDAPYELSPFVIDATDDQGYYASQTMAGGRTATQIIDTGTSIEVVTKDFLEDIGANNIEEFMQYTTSGEVGGANGNILGSSGIGSGSGGISSDGARRDPSGTARVRGIGSPDRTRNYYKSDIPLDSYNTERFDINRGSNSFLFGLGSPAGLVNSGLALAHFTDTNEVTFTIGTGGDRPSYRSEFDFNRVVIEDKLAVRIAALMDRRQYRQKPSYRDDDRIYANVIFRPFGDKGPTLRAYIEDGKLEGNAPDALLPQHAFDTFIDYRNPVDVHYNITHFGHSEGPTYDQWMELPESERSKFNWRSGPNGEDFGGDAISGIWAPGFVMIYDGRNGDLGPSFAHQHTWAGGSIWYNEEEPGDPFWDPAVLPDGSPGGLANGNPSMVFYRNSRYTPERESEGAATGFMNLNGYDFTRNNIGGVGDYYSRDFKNYNASLEQLFFGGNAGIELGFDYQEVNRQAYTNFTGWDEFQIDINKTLLLPKVDSAGNPLVDEGGKIISEAMPNPNFGRPFILTKTRSNEDLLKKETMRVTAFFKHDFAQHDGFLRWFGKHHLTALFDRHEDELQTNNSELRGYGVDFDAEYNTNMTNIGESRRMVYFGPAIQSYINDPFNPATPISVNDIIIESNPYPMREKSLEVPVMYWSRGTLHEENENWANGDEAWANGTMGYKWVPTDGNRARYTKVTSWAVNTQSMFFNDNLVVNAGYREDVVDNWLNTNQPWDEEKQQFISDPSVFTPYEGRYSKIDKGPTGEGSFGYGGVLHMPKNLVIATLPDSLDLSFHYNYSKNFVPDATRLGVNTTTWSIEALPSPEGESKDYGVTIRMWDNKFVARLNWFESNVLNANNNLGGTLNGMVLNMFDTLSNARKSILKYDADQDGVWDEPIPAGFDPDRAVEVNEAFGDALDNRWVKAWMDHGKLHWQDKDNFPKDKYSLEDRIFADKWPRKRGWISGLQDTQDKKSEGFELNLTYNPTKSWRIAFNTSKIEAVDTNIGRAMSTLMDDFGPIYARLKNYHIWDPAQLNVKRSNDAHYGRHFRNFYKSKLQEGSAVNEVRKWRFNLTTNYTFRDGFLKGFNVGGSVRWQEAGVIGYPFQNFELAPATETVEAAVVRVPDVKKPYYGDEDFYVDLKFGYKRKIFNGKVDWNLYLNVKNVQNLGCDNLSPVAIDPDGTVRRVRWDPPMDIRLTSKFSF